MSISGIIPTTFLPITRPEEKNDSNPRRITLINKNKDALVCILSRGIEEVNYEKPVEDALVLKMFGPKNVGLTYEPKVTFHKREIDQEKFYTIAEVENGFTNKMMKKKIPFLGHKNFLSYIVPNGEGLDKKVNDLLTIANDRLVIYCEAIADRGFFRASSDKRVKEIGESYKEVASTIYNDINALFHEETNNLLMRKHDLKVIDRSLGNYFDDPRPLSNKIKCYALLYGFALPFASLLPASFPDYLEKDMKSKYAKRFDQIQDENEKAAIALSEFAAGNPKLMSGIRRGYSEFKAAGNLSTYSLQLLATSYAVCNWSPWLSVPMCVPAAITGATMFRNAVRSGWQDYSGVISTLFDKVACKIMESRDLKNRKDNL